MGEIERYRERVEASWGEVAALARLGWGQPGPPDPKTGERWDRANVLGHMAEMLPFWSDQVRAALGGETSFGRGEAGYAKRREAIDGAHEVGEDQLLAQIDSGLAGLLGLLAEMRDEDLDRKLTYRSAGGEQEVDLRYPVEELLIGHVEAHLRQLRELG